MEQEEETIYFVDTLDENVVSYLNDIVQLKLEDQSYNYFFSPKNMKDLTARISLKQKSQTTQKILDLVLPLFEKAGLKVNPNNGYINYTSYVYNSPKYVDNGLDIDAEGSNYWDDVNVCYLITKKSSNLKGGNMEIFGNDPSFLQFIGYEKEEKETLCLDEGTVFIKKGKIRDKLQGCSGYGNFNFIKVILYEKQRFGYSEDNDDDGESNN